MKKFSIYRYLLAQLLVYTFYAITVATLILLLLMGSEYPSLLILGAGMIYPVVFIFSKIPEMISEVDDILRILFDTKGL